MATDKKFQNIGKYVLVIENEYIEDHGDSNYQKNTRTYFSALEKECCVFSKGVLVSYNYDEFQNIPVPTTERINVSSYVDDKSAYSSTEENTYVSICEVSSDGCFYCSNELVYCNPYLKGSCSPTRDIFRICSNAFKNCMDITEINLPEGINYIEQHAFYNCTSLKKVTLPSSLYHLDQNAFYGCDSLNSIDMSLNFRLNIDDFKNSWFYDKFSRSVETEIIDGATYIGTELVKYNPGHTGVAVIKEGTTAIKEEAFHYCSIEKVIFPKSLECIGDNAFHMCESLVEVVLPENITRIGKWAFSICSKLEKVVINSRIEDLNQGIFYACKSLKEIYFPPTLKRVVGGWNFRDCTSLEYLIFPDGFESITGEDVYPFCKSLRLISLPASVKKIGVEYRNYDKISLFPENPQFFIVCKEGSYAEEYAKTYHVDYEYFSSIEYSGTTPLYDDFIRFANPVKYNGGTYIRTELVKFDSSYKDIALVREGTTQIRKNAFDGSLIKGVILPDSLESIGKEAFCDCSELTEIVLPKNVKNIGDMAFALCDKLEKVVINSEIEILSSGMFYGCSALREVQLPSTLKRICDENIFCDINDFVLKCKKGSYADEYAQKFGIKCEYI